jgi:hypothetical protein
LDGLLFLSWYAGVPEHCHAPVGNIDDALAFQLLKENTGDFSLLIVEIETVLDRPPDGKQHPARGREITGKKTDIKIHPGYLQRDCPAHCRKKKKPPGNKDNYRKDQRVKTHLSSIRLPAIRS